MPVVTPQPSRQACSGGHDSGTGMACLAETTVRSQKVPMPRAGLRVMLSRAVRMRGSALRLDEHRLGWPRAQKRQRPQGARHASTT